MKNLSVRLLVLAGALCIGTGALLRHRRTPRPRRRRALAQLGAIDELSRRDVALAVADAQAEDSDRYFASGRSDDAEYLRWMRDLWQRPRRAGRAPAPSTRRTALAWLCIHRFERNPEQGWTTRTGNGYYGGLQMDISFQRTLRRASSCAARGTANRWTAGRADVGRQSAPTGAAAASTRWPNTARYCGLI